MNDSTTKVPEGTIGVFIDRSARYSVQFFFNVRLSTNPALGKHQVSCAMVDNPDGGEPQLGLLRTNGTIDIIDDSPGLTAIVKALRALKCVVAVAVNPPYQLDVPMYIEGADQELVINTFREALKSLGYTDGRIVEISLRDFGDFLRSDDPAEPQRVLTSR